MRDTAGLSGACSGSASSVKRTSSIDAGAIGSDCKLVSNAAGTASVTACLPYGATAADKDCTSVTECAAGLTCYGYTPRCIYECGASVDCATGSCVEATSTMGVCNPY